MTAPASTIFVKGSLIRIIECQLLITRELRQQKQRHLLRISPFDSLLNI